MGLGGDLPPAPAAPAEPRVATAAPAAGLAAPSAPTGRVAAWRRGPLRFAIVTAVLLLGGYVFAWGDVEAESRVAAALAGAFAFALVTFSLGLPWWILRIVIGRRRPFWRTVFNYGLVGVVAVFAILGSDDVSG